jgi:hypothetical protein
MLQPQPLKLLQPAVRSQRLSYSLRSNGTQPCNDLTMGLSMSRLRWSAPPQWVQHYDCPHFMQLAVPLLQA